MARSANDLLGKRNSKLEAFLKRHLTADTFERIRAHESCVVCSETDNKRFMFVILTDEWIYLTENPPRKVYETVHLKNITSISLVSNLLSRSIGKFPSP